MASTNTIQSEPFFTQPSKQEMRMLTLPIILCGQYFHAMLDTGSTFSLIQESCWRQLESKQKWKSSGGQSFLLANGQVQTALGCSDWEGDVFGQKFLVTIFSLILGMDYFGFL